MPQVMNSSVWSPSVASIAVGQLLFLNSASHLDHRCWCYYSPCLILWCRAELVALARRGCGGGKPPVRPLLPRVLGVIHTTSFLLQTLPGCSTVTGRFSPDPFAMSKSNLSMVLLVPKLGESPAVWNYCLGTHCAPGRDWMRENCICVIL